MRNTETTNMNNDAKPRMKSVPLLDPEFDADDMWMRAIDWPLHEDRIVN